MVTEAEHQALREVESFTKRQREVLALLAKGLTNPQIGDRLGISRDGAKWHVGEILLRLGIDSREEAADVWRRYNGLPCRLNRIGHRFGGAAALRWLAGGVGAGAVAGVVAIVAITYTGSGNAPQASSPSATASPTVSTAGISTYPSGTRTGIQSLDRIIAAIASGDPAELIDVTSPTSIACEAEPLGIGSPPKCPPGVAVGTGVLVVPGGCPERSFQPYDEFRADPRVPGVGKSLYAIARITGPGDQQDLIQPGDYQIFYGDEATGEGESVIVGREAIVDRHFTCASSVESLWAHVSKPDIVLPPAGTYTIPPPAAGITPVDGRPAPFVSYQGVFGVSQWDDRALSEREKAADPRLNPAWVPFSQCLADRGLKVRPNPSQPFTQADMDRLIVRLNVEYPDRDANNKLLFEPGGDAANFLECAHEWLTKSPQQIYEITGVPNRWWPPDATVTATPTE